MARGTTWRARSPRNRSLSPRANLVWTAPAAHDLPHRLRAELHAASARADSPADIALFNNTTKQSQIQLGDPVKAEREHYFDGGIEQRLKGGFKLAVDAYYKIKRNLLDEGQFGSSLVLSPFNYAKGYAWGVELSGNYTHGPLDLYANLARGDEKAKDIVSAQYFFAPDELAYIQDHYIYTDHSQKVTASGGASYTIKDGVGTLVPTADFVYGRGSGRMTPTGLFPMGASSHPTLCSTPASPRTSRSRRTQGTDDPGGRPQSVRQEVSAP